jgi:FixJ family two-component response regulator
MPETSGLDLLKLLRERDPLLPVIVVTGQGSIADAVSAMKLGAIEFLEKPNCIHVLRDHVKIALERGQYDRERARCRAAAVASLNSLSSSERTVVEATASGAQDKTIASWLDVSVRTVQLRRTRAMKKLAVRNKADMIRLVHTVREDSFFGATHGGTASAGEFSPSRIVR